VGPDLVAFLMAMKQQHLGAALFAIALTVLLVAAFTQSLTAPEREGTYGQMSNSAPTLVAINHDEYHASLIGKTQDGRQFFITTPFVAASGDQAGSEFLAVFLFEENGSFLEAHIDDLGPRAKLDHKAREALRDQRLAELGRVRFGRIVVAPFSVQQGGVEFGLLARQSETDGMWWVELHPGNFMAFYAPWDSGDYDT
jgi:hypothetical protein